MIFTSRLSNSGLIFAMYPSSVVQTGVKSRGCENRTAHESPIQSWKRIRPSVVSASKSGAVSPICSAIFSSLLEPQRPSSCGVYQTWTRLFFFPRKCWNGGEELEGRNHYSADPGDRAHGGIAGCRARIGRLQRARRRRAGLRRVRLPPRPAVADGTGRRRSRDSDHDGGAELRAARLTR